MTVVQNADALVADPTIEALTSALVDAYDQLVALYELSKSTTGSLDEAHAIEQILEHAAPLVKASSMTFEIDGITVCTLGDPEVAKYAKSVDVTTPTEMVATLRVWRDEPMGTAQSKLLTAIANTALQAAHTSRLHESAVESLIVERDHDTASALAQLALPSWRPELPGLSLFARSDPARSAGGDLFAWSVRDDRLLAVVGDVSGKGLPAALVMSSVISSATAAFQTVGDGGPVAVLAAIDASLHAYLTDASMFVTLAVIDVDAITRTLRLVSAGHSPILWRSNDRVEHLTAACPPVGVLELSSMGPGYLTEHVLDGTSGDRLVIASDGLTEQESPTGDQFGDDRLIEFVVADKRSAFDTGTSIFETIDRFADDVEQMDDRTLFVLDWTPS